MDRQSSPPRRSTIAHSAASPVSPPRSSASVPRKPAPITRNTPTFALHPNTPRHILVPTTRAWPPPHNSARSPRHAAKLSKRHGSLDLTQNASTSLAAVVHENAWLEHLANLNVQVIESGVELFGYQIFAVEQWHVFRDAKEFLVFDVQLDRLVDRAKIVRTVTVYTGNPRDRILATILGPVPGLASSNTEDLFQRTLYEFRKDGARPRETERGVILITSLASFRSDLNIVQIPNGDVLACKDDLYVNVNLQRLGASGRSGLNLDEPTDSCKDRFLQMYGISEPSHLPSSTTPKAWFRNTVLELVRTVQSALSLFGMFSLASDERDGLLCDSTLDGMQEWIVRIGVEFRLESIDKALDPPAVAALFSLVISLRNKLSSLAIPQLPKDPFIDPVPFLHALPSLRRETGGSRTSTSSYALTSPSIHFIDWELINRVQDAYAKSRQTEPYKVHRVLKNKLEDLTTVSTSLATNLNLSLKTDAGGDTRTSHASSASGVGHGHSLSLSGTSTPLHGGVRAEHFIDGPDIVDIDTFTKLVSSSSKSDVPPSIRDLFGGKPGYHRHLREQEEAQKHASSSASLSARYPLGLGGQWDNEAEDNSYAGMIWRGTGGRVQRKGQALAHGIAELTGIDSKGKKRKNKHSVDGLGGMDSDTSGGHHGLLPSVVITSDKSPDVTDHEDRDNFSMNPYSPTPSYRSPASSVTNLSDYDRNIRKFNTLAAPLDVVSLRALGQTHSSPTAPTLARVRAGEILPTALVLPGIDNVRAASTSVESVLLPEDLGLAFDFPGHGHLGYADGSVHQRWKRKFAASSGMGFTDDMGVMDDEEVGRGSGAGEDDQLGRESTEAHRMARLARRRSISDISDYTGLPVLDIQYMQTDAELAYQYMLLKEKELHMKNVAAVLEIMTMSLNGATDKLSQALAPQTEAQPSIWARYTALSDMTGQGRTEANLLKQQARTSNYQTERLLEGSDRLDQTLQGYRKRMDDVEHAVSGLYALEPYPVQQDEKWEDEDEVIDPDREVMEDEPVSPKAPPASARSGLFGWFMS